MFKDRLPILGQRCQGTYSTYFRLTHLKCFRMRGISNNSKKIKVAAICDIARHGIVGNYLFPYRQQKFSLDFEEQR